MRGAAEAGQSISARLVHIFVEGVVIVGKLKN